MSTLALSAANRGSVATRLAAGIIRACRIVLFERRLPGRCYQFYFSLLNRLGIRFATAKSSNGLVVRGYTHCFGMFYEVWSKHDYDIPGIAFAPGMIVVDIGANQGFFSLYAASKGATVHAFEPCADNFELLSSNVAKNRLQSLVRCFNKAVTGKNGEIPLFVGFDARGGILSGSVSTANPNRGGCAVEERSVESVTLDSILQEFGISKCDFLKMDCEGAEYEILRNTSADSFRKIGAISMECHDSRMHEAAEILMRAGFEILKETSGEAGMLKARNRSYLAEWARTNIAEAY